MTGDVGKMPKYSSQFNEHTGLTTFKLERGFGEGDWDELVK